MDLLLLVKQLRLRLQHLLQENWFRLLINGTQ
ncbi:hypothetical protein SB02110_05562 [Klebsiella quasipneumoniae subsp. quasipneumoniae]|nr:hypothetical protein SB02110_05562 [Klebsiella quasipneumoniae subsp. quasipneumoniae]